MSESNIIVSFIDTNVWLYAFIKSQDEKKNKTAKDTLKQCQPVTSTQVINEVCVNLLKKANFTEEKISQLIESFFEKYRIIHLNRTILLAASNLRQRYSFSFWDSVVVSSALQSNASVLYSEDMQDGIVIEDRLQIVNPFANEKRKGHYVSE